MSHTNSIPDEFMDLLTRPVVASLATVLADGQPHLTPVWVMAANGRVIVNTARGRQKDKNLHQRPQATVLLLDPENPYRYLEIRGRVTRESEEGARDMINQLSLKYRGNSDYPNYPGETRVTYEIEPTRVTHSMM